MGNMEGRLGYATPTTTWHQSHWWKSPRWIVIRIEALAVVAIIISFLLVAFGSCRRWSNSWIVQKGFFAAQVLSLSLGTYSIGLMQSSSVKSEMYPIWTVSLFTLFGCIDPVTTYNGLDYKGPLSKVVFGICLNCGYVLLMSISTISNAIGKTAITTLSAITFIKGFHRSFALVQQNRMCNMVDSLEETTEEARIFRKDEPISYYDQRRPGYPKTSGRLVEIQGSIRENKDKRLRSCYDVCVAFCLYQKLQCYFLGLDYRLPSRVTLKGIDFMLALKVVEIELALVYDTFFTGNPFLHYYQAKTASLWALVSFIGICFVLVATAIPGGITRHSGASGCTKVVGTTTADLAITFGILVSLALLQLMQLVQSWTSNWARAAVACLYARKDHRLERGYIKLSGWMRLKVFSATSTNLFDKCLWQDKINQYSVLPEPRLLNSRKIKGEGISSSDQEEWMSPTINNCPTSTRVQGLPKLKGLEITSSVELPTSTTTVQGFVQEYMSPTIKGQFFVTCDNNNRGGVNLDNRGEGIWSPKKEAERIWSSETKVEWIRRRCGHLFHMLGLRLHLIWDELWKLLRRCGINMNEKVRAPIPEQISPSEIKGAWIRRTCVDLVQTFGLHYIWEVIWELVSTDTCKRGGVNLDEDVKASITEFLGQIQTDTLDWNWLSSLPDDEPEICHFLPHFSDPQLLRPEEHCYRYTSCVMTWHIVTWYCEVAEQKKRQEDALEAGKQRRGGKGGGKTRDHRYVANVLSQYCVYLVKSAPELLPGPVAWTKRVYNSFVDETRRIEACGMVTNPGAANHNNTVRKTRLMFEPCDVYTFFANLSDYVVCTDWYAKDISNVSDYRVRNGEALANLLMRRYGTDKIWKTLELVWVQLLVYAAPYGNAEAHMRHLSQGGEFITHLWALLYHLDIRKWKVQTSLEEITTWEEGLVQRVLSQDGHAVVAYVHSQYGTTDQGEFATASRLVDGVRYYYTSNDDLARLFRIQRNKQPDLVFVKKEANNHKFVFYEGMFRAYDIARFVTENKIALANDQAQATSTYNPAAQSSENNEGQSEDKIKEKEEDEGQCEDGIEGERPRTE